MNPVRYWMRITIASNPKRMPQTAGQVMSIFVANLVVLLIVSSFSLVSHIVIGLLPAELGVIIFLLTLVPMVMMLMSLFRRMFKVREWRYKSQGPAE